MTMLPVDAFVVSCYWLVVVLLVVPSAFTTTSVTTTAFVVPSVVVVKNNNIDDRGLTSATTIATATATSSSRLGMANSKNIRAAMDTTEMYGITSPEAKLAWVCYSCIVSLLARYIVFVRLLFSFFSLLFRRLVWLLKFSHHWSCICYPHFLFSLLSQTTTPSYNRKSWKNSMRVRMIRPRIRSTRRGWRNYPKNKYRSRTKNCNTVWTWWILENTRTPLLRYTIINN